MALGKFLKSIFGGASKSAEQSPGETREYEGFIIEANPIAEGGNYRTAGYISGELDGEIRRIQFIRADLNSDKQVAIDHAFVKGQQIIDEQGAKLLHKSLL